MKLGVSLVVIGKSIFNWLLPETPTRYPTLSRSELRNLWSDKSNLSKTHSLLAPAIDENAKNPLYEKGPANNSTYEDPSQLQGVAPPP